MDKNINIITDLDGSKVVLINDLRFVSRKDVDWTQIETYLMEYVGEFFEIAETSDKVYIGTDFPDEFSHSMDTKGLKGANKKERGKLERYNIYQTRMLVRCDKDGKLYLYDLVRTKKETSRPLE